MSPGPTFDRIYAALKEQLLSGRWSPGSHLEPGAIADDLSASITPVRDALHRLVGERLVEAPRHDGFWVPAMSEPQLRELYQWQGDLLAWALRNRQVDRSRIARTDIVTEPESLFREIARGAQNGELAQTIVGTVDRLAPFRAAERLVFEDLSAELTSLELSLRQSDDGHLRRRLIAYHKRRQRAAPLILAALRREASDRQS